MPGKGRGLLAKVNIPRGTRILAEKGLLNITDNPTIQDVLKAYQRLSPTDKKVYLKLHPYANSYTKRFAARQLKQPWSKISPKYQKIIAIWAANNFENVFRKACFINHSCIPNLSFAWNKDIGRQTFHAARDIKAGEELTIQYNVGINQRRAQRQERLRDWGFKCECPACEDTPHGQRHERKRAELYELERSLQHLARASKLDKETLKQCVKLVEKLAKIQMKEGIVHREHAGR